MALLRKRISILKALDPRSMSNIEEHPGRSLRLRRKEKRSARLQTKPRLLTDEPRRARQLGNGDRTKGARLRLRLEPDVLSDQTRVIHQTPGLHQADCDPLKDFLRYCNVERYGNVPVRHEMDLFGRRALGIERRVDPRRRWRESSRTICGLTRPGRLLE